jgi:glycosyltransferase involved in cell wall biosynthesis
VKEDLARETASGLNDPPLGIPSQKARQSRLRRFPIRLSCSRFDSFSDQASRPERAPLTAESPRGVLLDLTPLETISSLRGIGRYVRGLATGLSQLASECAFHVEGVAATPDLERLFVVDDPFAYAARPVSMPVPRSPARRRRLIRRQMATLARERPGLLHLADPNGIPAKNSLPFTLTCHDLIPLVLHEQYLAPVPYWHKIYAALERSRYLRTRRILAVSHATKRDLVERLDVDSERVDVVWHGVDHELFNPCAQPDERAKLDAIVGGPGPYVLYLGAGDARKDLDTLLAAFAESGLPREARLVLAGNLGVKRTRALTGKARKLRVDGAVHFAGYVPEALVPALYRQASVHAFLSRYEGFGLPVIEALACGAPTITSTGSSLDEVAGEGALVVPYGEQDALSSALKSAFFDTELRAQLEARGLARAQTFTWRKCAEQTIAFWQRASA